MSQNFEKRRTLNGTELTVRKVGADDAYPADLVAPGVAAAKALTYLCPDITIDEAVALARSAGGLPRTPFEAVTHIVGQIDYLRPKSEPARRPSDLDADNAIPGPVGGG